MIIKKPRILLIGPVPPSIGGISTFISDLLNSDLNKKFDLISFTNSRPLNEGKIPSIQNYQIIFNVNIFYLLKCIISTTYHLLIFPLILLKIRPDIVHIHTPSFWSFLENSCYLLISKLYGKKVILHVHGGSFDHYYLDSSNFMKHYIKYILSISNKVISLSKNWKKFFIEEIGINENIIVVIRNGIIFSKYNLKRKHQVNNKIEILFIGGMDAKRKGVYDVLKAIPLVLKVHSNAVFTFIGNGEIENIKEKCKTLGIENNVRIRGQVSETEKIKMFNSSDIFLLPSYAEGLPISILEAMASGLPVISTSVGAIPEVVYEGVNGYLIEPGDYETLAKKILLLAENRELRKKITENNILKVKNIYDMSAVAKEVEKVYKNTLSLD